MQHDHCIPTEQILTITTGVHFAPATCPSAVNTVRPLALLCFVVIQKEKGARFAVRRTMWLAEQIKLFGRKEIEATIEKHQEAWLFSLVRCV